MASGEVAEKPASGEGTFSPKDDPVISLWMDIRGLMDRAGKGNIVRVPASGLDRQAIIDNSDILEAVIRSYGGSTKLA